MPHFAQLIIYQAESLNDVWSATPKAPGLNTCFSGDPWPIAASWHDGPEPCFDTTAAIAQHPERENECRQPRS